MDILNAIMHGASVGDTLDFIFAVAVNALPDSVHFSAYDIIATIADVLDITVFEDGTFRIFEDGSVF